MSGDNDSSTNNPQAQIDDISSPQEVAARARIWDDYLAKHAKRVVPPDEEYVSPDWFNAHVTPDLEAVIRAYACFVRLDMADWTEALDQSFAYAWRRGAFGFSTEHLSDLQDWISTQLSLAIGPEY